jgi:tetratricopeptide (TPR) repeat protein
VTDDFLEHQADAAAAKGDFANARALLQQAVDGAPDHFPLWIKLAAMARALRDSATALTALDRALTLAPLDLTALLMRATVLNDQGDVASAGVAYGRALAHAPDPPPAQMQPVLDVAQQRYRAWQQQQAAHLRAALPENSLVTPALERFITNAVRITEADRAGPTHYCYPGLPEIPFHDKSLFAWTAELEAATQEIAAEFGGGAGALYSISRNRADGTMARA